MFGRRQLLQIMTGSCLFVSEKGAHCFIWINNYRTHITPKEGYVNVKSCFKPKLYVTCLSLTFENCSHDILPDFC